MTWCEVDIPIFTLSFPRRWESRLLPTKPDYRLRGNDEKGRGNDERWHGDDKRGAVTTVFAIVIPTKVGI